MPTAAQFNDAISGNDLLRTQLTNAGVNVPNLSERLARGTANRADGGNGLLQNIATADAQGLRGALQQISFVTHGLQRPTPENNVLLNQIQEISQRALTPLPARAGAGGARADARVWRRGGGRGGRGAMGRAEIGAGRAAAAGRGPDQAQRFNQAFPREQDQRAIRMFLNQRQVAGNSFRLDYNANNILNSLGDFARQINAANAQLRNLGVENLRDIDVNVRVQPQDIVNTVNRYNTARAGYQERRLANLGQRLNNAVPRPVRDPETGHRPPRPRIFGRAQNAFYIDAAPGREANAHIDIRHNGRQGVSFWGLTHHQLGNNEANGGVDDVRIFSPGDRARPQAPVPVNNNLFTAPREGVLSHAEGIAQDLSQTLGIDQEQARTLLTDTLNELNQIALLQP